MLALQLPSQEVSKHSFLSADVADYIAAKVYGKNINANFEFIRILCR